MFGWGTKTRYWYLNEESNLQAHWNYFHVFWCPIASSIRWTIIYDERSRDKAILYSQVQAMIPHGTPDLSVWQKYGLLIAIGIVVLIGLLG